jgi:CheY-like chemotaxis protein
MSGEEFAERYREMPPPRAPLVVVSVAQDAPVRALRIEARLVVPKPFDLGLLAHLVDTYA